MDRIKLKNIHNTYIKITIKNYNLIINEIVSKYSIIISWNCNIKSFTFNNLCNLPKTNVKLLDNGMEMSKHVAV